MPGFAADPMPMASPASITSGLRTATKTVGGRSSGRVIGRSRGHGLHRAIESCVGCFGGVLHRLRQGLSSLCQAIGGSDRLEFDQNIPRPIECIGHSRLISLTACVVRRRVQSREAGSGDRQCCRPLPMFDRKTAKPAVTSCGDYQGG